MWTRLLWRSVADLCRAERALEARRLCGVARFVVDFSDLVVVALDGRLAGVNKLSLRRCFKGGRAARTGK
ncbi:MAG: hypothetical protein ACYCVV_03320 [Acidimicrobiales bacterium]